MGHRRAVALSILALLVCGCDLGGGGDGAPKPKPKSKRRLVLPWIDSGNAWPAALEEGTLVIRDSCAFLGEGSASRMIAWPPGTVLRKGRVRLADGTDVGRTGDVITFGGGEFHSADVVVNDRPLRCKTSRFLLYGEPATRPG